MCFTSPRPNYCGRLDRYYAMRRSVPRRQSGRRLAGKCGTCFLIRHVKDWWVDPGRTCQWQTIKWQLTRCCRVQCAFISQTVAGLGVELSRGSGQNWAPRYLHVDVERTGHVIRRGETTRDHTNRSLSARPLCDLYYESQELTGLNVMDRPSEGPKTRTSRLHVRLAKGRAVMKRSKVQRGAGNHCP
jgi:hypothetical protein